MKNIANFLIGSLSSLGVAQTLPDAAQTAAEVPADLITTVEALISLVSGLLSAVLVAWLRKKWQKQTKKSGD